MARPAAPRRPAPEPEMLPELLPEPILPHITELVGYISSEVRRVVPEYSFDEPIVEHIVVLAMRFVVYRCPDEVRLPGGACSPLFGHGPMSVDDVRDEFRSIGRQEFRSGRDVEQLRSAFMAAGRASWHYLSTELGSDAGVRPEQLYRAAEAIFSTIEEICVLSSEGYAEARAQDEGTARRGRQRLLNLLLSDARPSESAVQELARDVGWTVPSRVVAVAVHPAAGQTGLPALPLGPDVLCDVERTPGVIVCDDPAAQLGSLGPRLGGGRAAIGPPVGVRDAGRSFAVASRALTLMADGVLPDGPVLDTGPHLGTMLLLADRPLLDRLVERTLVELADVPERHRSRLGLTLLSWLHRRGATLEIADDLGVHPQTVRYRMARLRELFGDRLDDPGERLDLLVALSACRALGRNADPETWTTAGR